MPSTNEKLLTEMIAEKMYSYMAKQQLIYNEQKGCRRRSSCTKDKLMIDKTQYCMWYHMAHYEDCIQRCTNMAMA